MTGVRILVKRGRAKTGMIAVLKKEGRDHLGKFRGVDS